MPSHDTTTVHCTYNAQVVAVDLEAHLLCTFYEKVCLIQLAAGGHSWIVDAIKLRPHLHLLQPIMLNARVLKLLHGGRCDVQWLQGLGIFLCNVLDTCELANVRSGPGLLLSRFALLCVLGGQRRVVRLLLCIYRSAALLAWLTRSGNALYDLEKCNCEEQQHWYLPVPPGLWQIRTFNICKCHPERAQSNHLACRSARSSSS